MGRVAEIEENDRDHSDHRRQDIGEDDVRRGEGRADEHTADRRSDHCADAAHAEGPADSVARIAVG